MKTFLIALSIWSQIVSGHIPPATGHGNSSSRYRLATEYRLLGPQGAQLSSHLVTGDFTSAGDNIRWTVVTDGSEHQTYMEGFAYARSDPKITSAGFFNAFPADAHDQRNLVWDELMFHSFAQQTARLRLNEPTAVKSDSVSLGGSGTFKNRDIILTLVGLGRRNGDDCYIVHYEALLNHFVINAPNATVTGRSDYLGDLWISVRTHEIEYGTLLEEVAGVVGSVPGSAGPQPLHVLRTASLTRLQ